MKRENTSARLTLENFIFYRAACLRERIESVDGKWYSRCLDPYIQVGIYLYNSLWAETDQTVVHPTPQKDSRGGVKNGWILPCLPFYQNADSVLK